MLPGAAAAILDQEITTKIKTQCKGWRGRKLEGAWDIGTSQHHGVITATLDWLIYGLLLLGRKQSSILLSCCQFASLLKFPLSHRRCHHCPCSRGKGLGWGAVQNTSHILKTPPSNMASSPGIRVLVSVIRNTTKGFGATADFHSQTHKPLLLACLLTDQYRAGSPPRYCHPLTSV